MLQIGFTGSRQEPNKLQKDWLEAKLFDFKEDLSGGIFSDELIGFHHGDCLGSDAYAHSIAKELKYWIVVHPPQSKSLRAYCQGNELMEELNYLERNWEIVRRCEILIALSSTNEEIMRSGTWATVRYARKSEKTVYLCGPDGKMRTIK